MNMLQTKKEELKKQGKKGFTLMELLIVVAIIAVLVAIAIPLFTKQLETSRDTASVANVRSAYAQAQAAYLTEADDTNVDYDKATDGKVTVKVSKVKIESQQTGWSGEDSELPFDMPSGCDTDPGDYDITFSYGADGTITLSAAKSPTA